MEEHCKLCSGNVPDIIKILISEGAGAALEDNKGLTPIHYAIRDNHPCAIKALIESGFDINFESHRTRGTLLDFSICESELRTVSLLLNLGADFMRLDCYGRSCVHTAAMKGSIDVLELLSSKGANLCQEDIRGITPLHLASWYGQDKVVSWLLDQGISTELKDHMGWTPLHFAAEWDRIVVARLLLSRSADVNSYDCNLHTPLYWSNYCGHDSMTKLLFSWGGIENIFNKDEPLQENIKCKNWY